jgi:hypothetical protein
MDPEKKPGRDLSRFTPMDVLVDPNFDLNDPVFKAQWQAMMEREWGADWDRDFGPAPK